MDTELYIKNFNKGFIDNTGMKFEEDQWYTWNEKISHQVVLNNNGFQCSDSQDISSLISMSLNITLIDSTSSINASTIHFTSQYGLVQVKDILSTSAGTIIAKKMKLVKKLPDDFKTLIYYDQSGIWASMFLSELRQLIIYNDTLAKKFKEYCYIAVDYFKNINNLKYLSQLITQIYDVIYNDLDNLIDYFINNDSKADYIFNLFPIANFKYADKILEHILSNDLFGKKAIILLEHLILLPTSKRMRFPKSFHQNLQKYIIKILEYLLIFPDWSLSSPENKSRFLQIIKSIPFDIFLELDNHLLLNFILFINISSSPDILQHFKRLIRENLGISSIDEFIDLINKVDIIDQL